MDFPHWKGSINGTLRIFHLLVLLILPLKELTTRKRSLWKPCPPPTFFQSLYVPHSLRSNLLLSKNFRHAEMKKSRDKIGDPKTQQVTGKNAGMKNDMNLSMGHLPMWTNKR